MKKLTLILIISIVSQLSFGQLNPINNLTFQHWYSFNSGCPDFNCFSLYWEEPELSFLDTLIGYNIYQDSELWRFQDYIGAGCSEIISPCPDADFFNSFDPFWIKIKAVYNIAHLESTAIDSAQFIGPMMGIENNQKEKGKIYPNPTNGIINIDFENIRKIILLNSSGTKIQELYDKSFIDLSKYSKGIYYIIIITDRKIRIKKVVLE